MVVVIIVWSKYWCLFWAKILALEILEDTDKVHSKLKIMAHMSPSWAIVMNHVFVWDEPMIISYKPEILVDTLQPVWQISTALIYWEWHFRPCLPTTRFMSQQTHRSTEVLYELQLQLQIKNINLQCMRWYHTKTIWHQAQQNPRRTRSIKLGHGHWCGSHVGSCFKFVVPWQWADFLHLRDMLNSRNRLEINLTEQTHIVVYWLTFVTTNGTLIWLGNQCATHQFLSFIKQMLPGHPGDLKTACFGYACEDVASINSILPM